MTMKKGTRRLSNSRRVVMAENESNARLTIYTTEFLINGYVKLKPMKIGDKTMYSRRVSDIINSASERMAQAGEPDFIEVRNVDMKDLKTNEVVKGIRSLVISKSAIRIIIPSGYLSQTED